MKLLNYNLECGCGANCGGCNDMGVAAGQDGTDGANAFVYVASADDAVGTGFTYPANVNQCFMAIINSTVALTPVVGDFAGKWFNKCASGTTKKFVKEVAFVAGVTQTITVTPAELIACGVPAPSCPPLSPSPIYPGAEVIDYHIQIWGLKSVPGGTVGWRKVNQSATLVPVVGAEFDANYSITVDHITGIMTIVLAVGAYIPIDKWRLSIIG